MQGPEQEPAGSPSAASRKGWENLGSSVVSRYSVGEEMLDTTIADVQLNLKEAVYHFWYYSTVEHLPWTLTLEGC